MIDEAAWRVQDTADYICSRQYSVVTLQFPDEQLKYAAGVTAAVKSACAGRGHAVQAYILADTTYNSLSVDEVAAAHVNAQCVVHYGRASLTKLSRLPAFFVFPEEQLNVPAAAACLASSSLLAAGSDAARVLVFLDQPLLHQLDQLKAALLALLQQQQGGQEAAERLVFPAVPHQHMVPENQQQQEPQQQLPVVLAASSAAGCCGGGACGAQQPQAGRQQEVHATEEWQPRASCCAAACCQGSANSSSGAMDEPASGSSTDAAGAAAQTTAPPEADAGGGSVEDGDGQQAFSLAGYQWHLPAGMHPTECGLVWVGAPDAPALLHLQLTYSICQWAMLDPSLLPPASSSDASAEASAAAAAAAALKEGLPLDISRALRRRYFLVEKARDASIVGILVGTLGAAGYADAVDTLRRAAREAGKKTYTLLMGKPSPAKLANFPEIEVFVLVADPQGQILDSKDYLAPIITPHEALLAFTEEGGQWDEAHYRLDFDGVLQSGISSAPAAPTVPRQEPRFSLLAGAYTGGGGSGSDSEPDDGEGASRAASDPSTALALHAQQALQVSAAPQGRSDLVEAKSAADYFLHKRTWQGVEAPLVGAAPKAVELAAEGLSGRAAGYAAEGQKQDGC